MIHFCLVGFFVVDVVAFPSNKEKLASWKVQESSYASCWVSVCFLVLTQSYGSFVTMAVTEAGVHCAVGKPSRGRSSLSKVLWLEGGEIC